MSETKHYTDAQLLEMVKRGDEAEKHEGHRCIANSCNGLHRGAVRNLSFRLEPSGPWTDSRWVCENAVATLRGIWPKLESRDYAPDKLVVRAPLDNCLPIPSPIRDCEVAPLTAAQIEQMVQDASDPTWRARYQCWKCHKSMAANEAYVVVLASGSKVYYCAKDYAARSENIATGLGSSFAAGIRRDPARKTRVDPPKDHPPILTWKRKCDKCGVTSDGGKGKVTAGKWRDKYRSDDDWRGPRAFCETCLEGLKSEDIGFEWNPITVSPLAGWGRLEESSQPLGERCTSHQCPNVASVFCRRCDAPRCRAHITTDVSCCTTEGGYGPAVCGTPKCGYGCGGGFGGCKGKVQRGMKRLDGLGWTGPSWACEAAVERIKKVGEWVPKEEASASPPVPRSDANPPPPAPVPAKPTVAPSVLRQTYCENAPPREIVESTEVMLDGDECGGVPKTPYLRSHLVWSSHMKWEWERHDAWSKRWRTAANEAAAIHDGSRCLVAHRQYAAVLNRDVTPPSSPDAYGGLVTCQPGEQPHPILDRKGYRCRLCGGWIRVRGEASRG